MTAILAALALVAAIASGGNHADHSEGGRAVSGHMQEVRRQGAVGGEQTAVGHSSQSLRFVLPVPFLAADGIATLEPVATATAEPTVRIPPTVEPTQDAPVYGGFAGEVTHFGTWANGLTMACGGTYWSSDTTIAAVAYPSRNAEWPCGQGFTVTGPAGTIRVTRQDSCPGCGPYHLDLSESGMLAVCGYLGRCPVYIRPD